VAQPPQLTGDVQRLGVCCRHEGRAWGAPDASGRRPRRGAAVGAVEGPGRVETDGGGCSRATLGRRAELGGEAYHVSIVDGRVKRSLNNAMGYGSGGGEEEEEEGGR
jgi:hypothetical protein